MAKTGWTFEYLKSLSSAKLRFMYYSLRKTDQDTLNDLASTLGLRWTRDDLRAEGTGNRGRKNSILLPLSMLLNPKVLDMVKRELGGALQTGPEIPVDAVNMAEMSPQEFTNAVQSFGRTLVKKDGG